jgi:hypothetical protein
VGSQQTAASAAQLHGLAAQLREAISRFTVDGKPASSEQHAAVPEPRTHDPLPLAL